MWRPAARTLANNAIQRSVSKAAPTSRFLTTAPPHKTSRSWKNSAVRWTLAGGLVYYYSTNNVFADEAAYAVHSPPETQRESETLPTLEQIAAQRHSQRQSAIPEVPASTVETQSTSADIAAPGSPEELEEEAGQQGAFNEETGEINWDCPCLGGMAHGPCGEEFRNAFSCFVYSKEEPKGVDCIDKFKGMQNCFREHPDIYGAELDDEEEGEAVPGDGARLVGEEPRGAEDSSSPSLANMDGSHGRGEKVSDNPEPDAVQGKKERSEAATQQVNSDHGITSESDEMVPKAWHDSK